MDDDNDNIIYSALFTKDNGSTHNKSDNKTRTYSYTTRRNIINESGNSNKRLNYLTARNKIKSKQSQIKLECICDVSNLVE